MSTPRLVSLPFRMSCTWSSWNRCRPYGELEFACSDRAHPSPLKSKGADFLVGLAQIAFFDFGLVYF